MDWVGVGEEGQGKLLLAAWVGAAWTWSGAGVGMWLVAAIATATTCFSAISRKDP